MDCGWVRCRCSAVAPRRCVVDAHGTHRTLPRRLAALTRLALEALPQIGAIGNALLSKILKRILRQDRPTGAPVSDPGMPSSHAMSLFFFAAYLSSAAAIWSSWPLAGRAAAIAGLLAFATNSASWRISAGFHTRDQVPPTGPAPSTA